MTWLYIIFITICFLVVIHIFRAIQKNITTQLEFDRFNAGVSQYLRSNDPNLCEEDLQKLKSMLMMSDNLMTIHAARPSSVFHSLFFIDFVENLIDTSYNYEERVKAVHSLNITVERLKNQLDDLIAWSVFYNTPFIVRLGVVFRITLSRILARMGTKEMFNYGKKDHWHKSIVFSYELDDWKRRWNIAAHKFHIG